MLVKLTNKGRDLLNWGPDRLFASVSNKRAFTFMEGGYANQDNGFMSMYLRNNPPVQKETPAKRKPTPRKKKREKTTSRRARKREKAVMED